jgi:hypothetical protein
MEMSARFKRALLMSTTINVSFQLGFYPIDDSEDVIDLVRHHHQEKNKTEHQGRCYSID